MNQRKLLPIRIASTPQLDVIPVFLKFQQNTRKLKGLSFWDELEFILLNCIIRYVYKYLNSTYSVTQLLLRSWEERRLTNWSRGQRICLVSKERHNSDLGKFLNTVLTGFHDSKGIESLGKTLKKCILYHVWLQCLKQLIWSNVKLDPQIKDEAGLRTQ